MILIALESYPSRKKVSGISVVIIFVLSFSILFDSFIPHRDSECNEQSYDNDSEIHTHTSFFCTTLMDTMAESRYAMIHINSKAITDIMGLPMSIAITGLLVISIFERNSSTAR